MNDFWMILAIAEAVVIALFLVLDRVFAKKLDRRIAEIEAEHAKKGGQNIVVFDTHDQLARALKPWDKSWIEHRFPKGGPS